jgi:PhnB protein
MDHTFNADSDSREGGVFMAKVKPIPEGLHTITPHIVVEGAADAIAFYQKAFGAEERMRAPDPSGKKIWHAVLRFGDSSVFINDAFPDMGGGAKTIKLWLYSDNVDGVFARAVEAGAKVNMAPADMFWGDRMAQVSDRWGNEWSLAQHTKDLTPEEMKKAQDDFVAKMKKP